VSATSEDGNGRTVLPASWYLGLAVGSCVNSFTERGARVRSSNSVAGTGCVTTRFGRRRKIGKRQRIENPTVGLFFTSGAVGVREFNLLDSSSLPWSDRVWGRDRGSLACVAVGGNQIKTLCAGATTWRKYAELGRGSDRSKEVCLRELRYGVMRRRGLWGEVTAEMSIRIGP
jgi:hypothetical protein